MAGPVTQALIDDLKLAENPCSQILQLMSAKKHGLRYLDKVSLVVKLVDTQRKLHFSKPISVEPPSLRYVEPSKHKDFKYDPNRGGTRLMDYVPKPY